MKTPFWFDALPFVLLGAIMTIIGFAIICSDGSERKGPHPNTATIPAIRILTGGS
jgi:hypothetical protein